MWYGSFWWYVCVYTGVIYLCYFFIVPGIKVVVVWDFPCPHPKEGTESQSMSSRCILKDERRKKPLHKWRWQKIFHTSYVLALWLYLAFYNISATCWSKQEWKGELHRMSVNWKDLKIQRGSPSVCLSKISLHPLYSLSCLVTALCGWQPFQKH